MFDDPGISEDDAHVWGTSGAPAFLEVAPDSYKPIHECSRSEIESTIISLTMQAQALTDKARTLERYLDDRDGA